MKKKRSHEELEREEEKTGIDYDHDDEKGESPEHIAKFEKAKKKRLKKFKEWLGDRDPVMARELDEKKWIQGAVKHPGRCTPAPNPDCPVGSPQYKLAMRFKKGDIHKDNEKKDKD